MKKGPLLLSWKGAPPALLLEWRREVAVVVARPTEAEAEPRPTAQPETATGAAAPHREDPRPDGSREPKRSPSRSAAALKRVRVTRDYTKWHQPEFAPLPPEDEDAPRPKPTPRPKAPAPRARPVGARSGMANSRLRQAAAPPPVAERASRDFIIVPRSTTFRASEQGIRAVINYLNATQILSPVSEHHEGDDLFVTLKPGPFSHLAFTQGGAPEGAPSLLEAVLFSGSAPRPLPWGDTDRRACFYLAILGSRFGRVDEQMKARLHQIIYLGPEVVDAEHDPGRLSPAGEEFAARVESFAFEEF